MKLIIFLIFTVGLSACMNEPLTKAKLKSRKPAPVVSASVSNVPWMARLSSLNAPDNFVTTATEYCAGIAVDSAGNVFCGGASYISGNFNIILTKFNSSGALQWVKHLDTAGGLIISTSSNEEIGDMAIDSEGNLYLVGGTDGSLFESQGTFRDPIIMKFDNDGNLLWGKQFGNTSFPGNSNGYDSFTKIDIDKSNNLYVAGYIDASSKWATGSTGPGNTDIVVVKFDKDGNTTWMHQQTTPIGSGTTAAGIDGTFDIHVDPGQDIIVGGLTYSALAGTYSSAGQDVALLKFSAAGSLLWGLQYSTTSFMMNAGDGAISTDSDGNIFVAGSAQGTFSGSGLTAGGGYDIILSKFNTSGVLQWHSHVADENKPPGAVITSDQGCIGVTITPDNRIFCAGTTASSFKTTIGGASDMFMVEFDSIGTPVDGYQLGTMTHFSTDENTDAEIAQSMFYDSAGQFYIGGKTLSRLYTEADDDGDIFIIKTDSAAQTKRLPYQLIHTAQAATSTVSSGGSVITGGVTYTNIGNTATDILLTSMTDSSGLWSIPADTCNGKSLGAGESCIVSISFDGVTGTTGSYSLTLTMGNAITSNTSIITGTIP